ncbi:hypothetical protein JXA88_03395 [Candidatus Fermentibacteria bacterium]|nr:hypothetical protein [Candidatus Fermentibacteria bacterium]
MVGEKAIGQAFMELERLKPSNATEYFRALADRQPELAVFVTELTDDLTEEASLICYSLFAVIVRAYELTSLQPVKPLDHRIVLRALRKNDADMEELGESSPGDASRRLPKSPAQPNLMALVIEALADAENVSDDDRGMMLLILKTIIDALHTATKPPRRTPRPKLAPSGEPLPPDHGPTPTSGGFRSRRPAR